jgi:hypothetical protein
MNDNEPQRLRAALRRLKASTQGAPETEYGNVSRFFGSWRKSIAFVYIPMAIVAVALVYITFGYNPHQHDESAVSQAGCQIPKQLQELDRGKDLECHINSPQEFRGSISKLQAGGRTDSVLYIHDITDDGRRSIVEAYGCGRRWTVTDSYSMLGEHRETDCNLGGHHTGVEHRMNTSNWDWAGTWNSHPQ